MEAKWAVVADQIRADIAAGLITDELPTETAVMERHAVSRTTVRKALQQLTAEGLIEGSQGTRRRVRHDQRWRWPMDSWERNVSQAADAWAATVISQGGTPDRTVTVSVEHPPPTVAAALAVPEDAQVVVRRRIRRIDGEAHHLADSYFPFDLVKDHPAFWRPGTYGTPARGGLLAEAGLAQVTFKDLIEARMPTPDESRVLRIRPGTPLLVHSRTGFTTEHRAVRHMITRMSADRVELCYDLDA